ncbi:MAG: CheW domain-containing protein [Myxococcales bacterium]|nr:CheW domain-containing protein [Myxococcales bacterium]
MTNDRHLTFAVAGELCALPLASLREVVAGYSVAELPHLPAPWSGVATVRDEVVPLVALGRLLGYEAGPRGPTTRALLLCVDGALVGLEVDEVRRVVEVPATSLHPLPELGRGAQSDFVRAASELPDGRLLLHLEVTALFDATLRQSLAELRPRLGAAPPGAAAPEAGARGD